MAGAFGELVERYGLTETASGQLWSLLELIASDPLAPTTIRTREEIVADHLADSLVALELAEVRGADAIADLGSGAGFPGLPLAIALPGSGVVLIESSARKCAFISRAIERCGVCNARAVHARAEEWRGGASTFDLVTARAVAPLAAVAEYAAPLLRIGGSLVAWRGRRDPAGEAQAARAAAELGLAVREPVPVRPHPAAEHRHMHLMSKLKETPSRFPRRPGMARKRPLGRS